MRGYETKFIVSLLVFSYRPLVLPLSGILRTPFVLRLRRRPLPAPGCCHSPDRPKGCSALSFFLDCLLGLAKDVRLMLIRGISVAFKSPFVWNV